MKYQEKEEKGGWQRRKLLFVHLYIALVFFFFFYLPEPIRYLDTQAFLLFNDSLKSSKGLQLFWSLLNHKVTDWVGDGVMLTLFLCYIYKGKKSSRLKRFGELLLFVLCMSAIILLVNTYLFRHPLRWERKSPTLVFPEAFRVSYEIISIKIKETSWHSFPGDHATTAIMFALFFTYLARFPLACFSIAYGILFSLPRCVLGAHWLSDVMVGSLSIALFFFSWIMFTPFYSYFLKKFCLVVIRLQKAIAVRFTA